ncbi:uncharacterized protein METZ01_LOCUS390366 [marine metagenome]|uniref:Uncharacterized protein n=1 Tax=marine metagenome TaxID=408172 RepID=A0A382UTG2_9ZZZZ
MLRTLALEHGAGIAQQGFLPVRHLRGVELLASLASSCIGCCSHSASSATLLLNSVVNLRLFFISCFTLSFVCNLSNITRPAQL